MRINAQGSFATPVTESSCLGGIPILHIQPIYWLIAIFFSDTLAFLLMLAWTLVSGTMLENRRHLKLPNLCSARCVSNWSLTSMQNIFQKPLNSDLWQKLIDFYMPMKHDVPFQLKKSEVKQLYQLYITDFTLFGYSPAEFIDSASSDWHFVSIKKYMS